MTVIKFVVKGMYESYSENIFQNILNIAIRYCALRGSDLAGISCAFLSIWILHLATVSVHSIEIDGLVSTFVGFAFLSSDLSYYYLLLASFSVFSFSFLI